MLLTILDLFKPFYFKQFSFCISLIYTLINAKTVLFQRIQFSIGTQFQSQKQFYFK